MATTGMRVRRLRSLLPVLGLGLALAATGAAAESVGGEGLIVGKDLGERTITLSSEAVLHVDGGTRIVGAAGGRLPFEALQVARMVGGMAEADGDAMVRYQASRRGKKLVAERIRVLGAIAE